MPIVVKLLGEAIKGATVEEGLSSAAPNFNAPFLAIGNLYFDSMESYQNSFSQNAPEIMADIPNFSTIEPIVQISTLKI
ncbi:MAG: EthD family reductase [Flavobacteriaceae bacterium]